MPDRQLQLLPSSSSTEFIAVAILGPLLQTKAVDRFLGTIIDRYKKLSIAVKILNLMQQNVAYTYLKLAYFYTEFYVKRYLITASN